MCPNNFIDGAMPPIIVGRLPSKICHFQRTKCTKNTHICTINSKIFMRQCLQTRLGRDVLHPFSAPAHRTFCLAQGLRPLIRSTTFFEPPIFSPVNAYACGYTYKTIFRIKSGNSRSLGIYANYSG